MAQLSLQHGSQAPANATSIAALQELIIGRGDYELQRLDELQQLLESEPLKSNLMATPDEQAEYERLFAWRERWQLLAHKHEPGRLKSQQERIERRAMDASHKIHLLMPFNLRFGVLVFGRLCFAWVLVRY